MAARTHNGLFSVAGALARITRPMRAKRPFAAAQLAANWTAIVGAEVAGLCQPVKLVGGAKSGGVLHLTVFGAAGVEVQHLAPQIVERINRFFGYQAVARLRLVQGPVPAGRSTTPPPTDLTQVRPVTGIAESPLKAALVRLARAIARTGPAN